MVLRRIAERSPAWGLVLILVFLALLLVANAIQGTIGPFPSADGLRDVGYAFHLTDDAPTSMSYPFTRDIVTAILFLLLVLTAVLVHLQWQRMRRAIPKLVDSGAFVDDGHESLGQGTRRNIDMIGDLVELTNRRFARVGDFSVAWIVLAASATVLIVQGLKEVGTFRILAPRTATVTERAEFADQLYANWWAGLDSFPGWGAYALIAVVGIYLIVLQNVVGFHLIRFVLALAKGGIVLGVDPYNRDGVAGWRGVSDVLATVYISLLMHALGLSLIVFVIGFEGVFWIVGLLLLWIIVTPTYVLVPLVVFRRRITRAKDEEITRYLERAQEHLQTNDAWSEAREALVMQGVASLRELPDVPLSVSQRVTSVFVIFLPIAVSGLELWLTLRV